jgi:trimethylamine--corrinoid protein Co-methyltransferase
MLVLCDELAGMAKSFAAGIQVNEDTLAFEVTHRAYKDHAYLVDEHTLRHVRGAMWGPTLFQRVSPEEWHNSGSDEVRKRVREKLLDLL